MGIKLKELVQPHSIKISDLKGKVVAVDGMNMLYQFLTTIRQPDGSLLMNSKGNVTSHLNGLFYRCTKFIENGIKLVFVFDGKPPALKAGESARRAEVKREAEKKFEEAEKDGDTEMMKRYASRSTTLTKDMVDESKKLLEALGVPYVQAPSEGEAQAAYMTMRGDAFASVSQDFDSLLFGSVRLVRNLSVEGRRKRMGKLQFDYVLPEMIILDEMLNSLGLTREQLVVAGVLIGTDYDPGGVPGIGPKNALKLVKAEKDFDKIFEQAKWKEHWNIEWREVFDTIMNMPVERDYELKWRTPDLDELRKLLVETHEFSGERVDSKLKVFAEQVEEQKQTGLKKWF